MSADFLFLFYNLSFVHNMNSGGADMKYLKRVFVMLCVLLTIILLTSCISSPPSNASEEIARYSWISKNDSGNCRISFTDGVLKLDCCLSEKETVRLEGKYFADDNMITVESDDCGTVVLKYKLENEKMSVEMYNMCVVFIKE